METKPYTLQSPEQIAKDYGGNKQKIAEAMQMGIVDPTAGTMAAMFIDRMRSAAQTEAAPQQTVAQQVFTPPAPQMPMGAPAGLGATPQAAAMPAPAAAPPMGMPSPQAVPGMAEGGMVPPYMAGGGISSLPLPDDMFDESRNGGFNDGYNSGGLVAFAEGDKVVAKPSENVDPRTINVVGRDKEEEDLTTKLLQGVRYEAPSYMGGYDNTLGGNLTTINEEAPREIKRAQQYQEYLDRMLNPEEQKKRKQEDMWMALGQIGARMAQTPGSLLQAASAGISEALPGVAAAAKERRGEQRAAQQALVAEERTGNKELQDRAGIALDMLKNYNSIEQAFQSDNFKNTLTRLGIDADLAQARIMAGANIQNALIGAATQRFVGGLGYNERRGALFQQIASDWDKSAVNDPTYIGLVAKDPQKAAAYRNSQIMGTLNSVQPLLGSGGGSSYGTPPAGAVRKVN